jgi:cytoskeletal protein RodZ
MMVPKWMIGACIALAAVVAGEAVQAQYGDEYGDEEAAVGVQVTNQSSKAVKVKFVHEKLQAEGVVAPNSVGVVSAVFTGTEDSFVSVKVGKLPARKFKISGNEVR